MANQHGKTCAAAVVALLTGRQPNPMPVYNNACYSFVSAEDVVHVTSVHRYDADKKTMQQQLLARAAYHQRCKRIGGPLRNGMGAQHFGLTHWPDQVIFY